MIPQIIWLCLIVFSFGIAVANHGKPREGVNSAWYTIIAIIIEVTLLTWGGFFKSITG